MSLPLIYIAGPFRGPTPLDVRRNVERARDLGLRVAHAGGYPVIPHTMTAEFDKQLDDQFWLDGTMELLKRCDGMVLLPTWASSTGAIAEHQWAEDHDMPTHTYGVAYSPSCPELLHDDLLRDFIADLPKMIMRRKIADD